jgi:putative lipoprotein
MTYLFVTYQPGPDQISQIYAFSWILVIAVIHALWALEDGTDQGVVWNPFYETIGKSLGIDSGNLSILMFKLSVFITIGLWATIAALIGNGGGNVMDANLQFFLQWTGMSILALILGILLAGIISHSNQTPKINEVAIRITHIINYFLRSPFFAGVILQSLAMTYFFANMHRPNPGQMMQIRILSWVLFAVAISVIFCITTSDFSSSGSRNPPHKSSHLATRISTLSAIGLWITIAILLGSQ